MSRRLAVIVPYRNRAEQLARFVPHVSDYLAKAGIDASLHVVEQAAGGPFNRGKIKNCGFALARASADYFCFHDVDYLPLAADYSWSPIPARLAWFGVRDRTSRRS